MITIDIRKSNKCNEEYSAFVSFPYDNTIVNTIRSLSTRYWNNDSKEWEIPTKKIEILVSKLQDFDFTIKGHYLEDEKEVEVDNDKLVQSNFEFKTKPFEHQIEGFEYGLKYDRWLLGDEQGLGKALALDTKVYTLNGYKLMRDIEVGDYVFGKDGAPAKVIATYNHSNVEMYKITFSDGTQIECCKDHLWEIHDQHGTKVVDTKWFTEKDQFGKIRKDNLFSAGSNSYKYWIDRCAPIQFEYHKVAINPYLLGALLGDGGLTSNSIFFTTADEEMVKNINDCLPYGYFLHSANSMSDINFYIKGTKGSLNIIKKNLIDLGLRGKTSHTKFIPDIYKFNSVEVRTKVLQGLIDTDGYASKDNTLQYTTVSKQLCEDVRFLVESLGGIVHYAEKPCGYDGKITSISYTLTIKFDNPQNYCLLTRKRNRLKPRKFKVRRNIISVERIANADAKCITVDSKDHLYVIDNFIVTHNTKQVIDIAVAKKLANGYKHCLIICGVNGLKWNWCNEVHTHSNEGARILGQKERKNGNIVVGSSKDKLNDLKNINAINEYFLITNVETLRDSDIVDELKKLCKDNTIGMIALDEAHKCKNPSSQQGKGLLKLNAKTMIAMTGTPLMNTPLDLYIILKWLGYEKHAMYSFKNHYCVMGGYGGYEILGYKNLDELQERLNEIMLRRLKKDVLDLPEKTLVNEYVEMTPKQAVIYKEVTAEVKNNIDMIKTSPNPLAELIRMRQATGYTGILSSSVLESAKLDRLVEIVDEAIENGQKVVVFSNWTQMTTPAYERLAKKYSGAIITGEISTEERAKSVEKFQNDDNCKFIIGTIGAMGTGLTLTAGSVEVFLDEPWTMASKSQAIDRCHRIGAKSNITVYTLIAKGTVDERINEIVEQKGLLSDALIDGKIDKARQSELLDFLLS